MKKSPQTGMRVSVDTLAKIKVMAKADNRSITNYVETLVEREYKLQGGNKMSRGYRILEKYWDEWGASESTCIVDMKEIERLADEWNCTIDELLEQVEET